MPNESDLPINEIRIIAEHGLVRVKVEREGTRSPVFQMNWDGADVIVSLDTIVLTRRWSKLGHRLYRPSASLMTIDPRPRSPAGDVLPDDR